MYRSLESDSVGDRGHFDRTALSSVEAVEVAGETMSQAKESIEHLSDEDTIAGVLRGDVFVSWRS